jgi:20S proteasome subunit beta 3
VLEPPECSSYRGSADETSFGPFFIEPVIAGLPPKTELEPNPKPFISCMDT